MMHSPLGYYDPMILHYQVLNPRTIDLKSKIICLSILIKLLNSNYVLKYVYIYALQSTLYDNTFMIIYLLSIFLLKFHASIGF